jgi:ubiquinone/menaquinone biosynthesis C-methylase UbiE
MTKYSLGSDDPEIARLDMQAASLDGATRLLLQAAGIRPAMRVLDLGTGLGHVALAAAELVGTEGRVVGVDSSPRLLELAAGRASALPHVQFVEGDVRTWRSDEPFDAVVGRLILFHLPDPVAVLRHHLVALRPGGLVLALDFDLGAVRAEPPLPLWTQMTTWMAAAFRSAGANPVIGTRLALLLAEAGVSDVQTFGVQGYWAPDDPRGPALLSGVIRSLAPSIIGAGLATAEQLGLDTLTDRLAAAMRASGSVILAPTLAGAWGHRP